MLSYILEDAVGVTFALDASIAAAGIIVVAQWRGLVVIHVKTLADGLDIVVTASRLQASLEQALGKLLVIGLKAHHHVDLAAALFEHPLKSLGLRHCTGKTVENHSGGLGSHFIVQHIGQNLDHQFVGDKLSFGDIAIGNGSEFSAALDV